MTAFHSLPRNRKIAALAALITLWQFSFPRPVAAASNPDSNTNQIPGAFITGVPAVQTVPETALRLPEIPDRPQPAAKRTVHLSVTAYSSTPDQTSGDPFITASGTRVHSGTLAANFLPIGTRVRFPDHYGNKIFVVEDRMASRYWQHADIWMETRQAAKEWGNRYVRMEIL